MTVSFDFDGVAEHTELAQLASSLQATGHQTYILTGRKSDSGIRELLNNLGFPSETEIITKAGHDGSIRDFKSKMLQEIGADLYIDADADFVLPAWHNTKVLTFQRSRLTFGYVSRNKKVDR